jgi:hypothetical protein
MVRKGMLKMPRGNGPVKLLFCKFKTSNDEILVMVDGIAPIRWLLTRRISRRFRQFFKVGGIVPSNWLNAKMSILKRCRRLISWGREPMKLYIVV